jgi:class 3 adenylate cyclase
LIGLQIKLIREHSGEIDKIMGDGLMAYWFCDGTSKTSAPRAAVTCAQKVVSEFGRTVADTDMSDLSLRIGLHLGPACFGDFGTEERIAVTVLGETVNLAARYEQLRAEPGHSDSGIPGLGPVRISSALYEVLMQGTGEPLVALSGPAEGRVKQDRFPVYWIAGE